MFDNINNKSSEKKHVSLNEALESYAKVKVIGVGGGGCNAVNNMIQIGVMGVEFWVTNTDAQALSNSVCDNKLILGYDVTKGLGAGANPDVGLEAALESESSIKEAVKGADMIFIAAGMGGGTGTGAAPVIAKIARDMGILTVAVVTKPFSFEGNRRAKNAISGLTELKKQVDSLIVISNDRLLELIGDVPFVDAFKEADKILMQAVQAITDLISIPAQINLDFADVKTIMKDKGLALIGVGLGKGENKAKEAATRAIACPLLDTSIKGAKNAIVNVTSSNATLLEVQNAISMIKNAADHDIEIIYGMANNKHLEDEMVISVIATGFDQQNIDFFKEDPSVSKDVFSKESTAERKFRTEENDFIEKGSIYESSAFTKQLDMQKAKIAEAQRRSREKIDDDIKSGHRKDYEKTASTKLKNKDVTVTSEIPSFLRRFRR